MRTTLTLEPDVAALVKRAMREKKESLKTVVNEAIRRGLSGAPLTGEKEAVYKLPTFKVGKLLVPSLDDISEVLSYAEGDIPASLLRSGFKPPSDRKAPAADEDPEDQAP